MKLAQKTLNLNELNFILIIVGFQMITTLLPFFPSVLYRGVALGVALLCVLFTKKSQVKINGPAKLFMLILLLMIARCTYQVLFTPDRQYYPAASNMVLLFMYGITLLPVLAFLYGHDNIRWNRIIWILFSLCLIIIFYGVMFSASVNEGSGRMQLNERQSTLAFGDTSAFLLIISSALLMRFKQKKRFAWLLKGCLVVGIILAIVGIARAASRGPLVAGLIGMLFIVEALPIKKKLMIVAAGIAVFFTFGIDNKAIENFAPVLYGRMMNTIDKGDMSGRDYLYEEGERILEKNPLIGGNPVFLSQNGSFSSFHNCYLDVAVGLGYIGGFVFVCLVIYLIFQTIKYRKKFDTSQLMMVGLFYFFVIRSMSGVQMVSKPDYCLVMLYTALLLSVVKFRPKQ